MDAWTLKSIEHIQQQTWWTLCFHFSMPIRRSVVQFTLFHIFSGLAAINIYYFWCVAYLFVCGGYMVQVYRALPFFHKNKNLNKTIPHFAYRYRAVYFTFSYEFVRDANDGASLAFPFEFLFATISIWNMTLEKIGNRNLKYGYEYECYWCFVWSGGISFARYQAHE